RRAAIDLRLRVTRLDFQHRIEIQERLLILLPAHVGHAAVDAQKHFRSLRQVPVSQRLGATIDRCVAGIAAQTCSLQRRALGSRPTTVTADGSERCAMARSAKGAATAAAASVRIAVEKRLGSQARLMLAPHPVGDLQTRKARSNAAPGEYRRRRRRAPYRR